MRLFSSPSSIWSFLFSRVLAQHFNIFIGICSIPIFTSLFFTSCFSALQISLTLLLITFFKNTFPFIFLIGLVPLASRIFKRLRKYYRLEVQVVYLVEFAQILQWFAPHFTFLHSILVLHFLESLFSQYIWIYLFLFGVVPLAGGILGGSENAWDTAHKFNWLCQFLLQFAFNFTFWHSM